MDIRQILYMGYLYGVPISIAGVVFGMRWKEGFWSNFVSAISVFFSAIIAIGWWEPLAFFIADNSPMMLFFSDALALWGIFVVSLLILSETTRLISKVKLKFNEQIEMAGNIAALTLMFCLLYGFFLFTEDLSPVGANADETDPSDSIQVQVVRFLSAGNLSAFFSPNQFDSFGDFRSIHLERRKAIMEYVKTKKTMLYEGSIPPRGS